MTTTDRAGAFRALHAPGELLVLANAWDPGSARLIESLGAAAIATTSAGFAWAAGHADGDHIPARRVAELVAEIARVIRVPLTVDAEGGFSDDPAEVGRAVAKLVDAGAVGINLEDGSGSVDLYCAKLEAAMSAAQRAGVDLFVNARTDVYLRRLVPRERAIEEVISRAARYRAAGCSSLFVPGLVDAEAIRTLAAAVDPLPLNVMASPGLPAAAELRKLGVRRLSAGGAISMAAWALAAQLAEDFLRDGNSDVLYGRPTADYMATNALFAERG